MEHRQLLLGLVRLHILHHAAEQPVFGNWIIEELGRHSYKLSPGTLYPLLHGMERNGYLTSREERSGGRVRRMYRATPMGREALAQSKDKIRELFRELIASE